jgi:hypothetical protein
MAFQAFLGGRVVAKLLLILSGVLELLLAASICTSLPRKTACCYWLKLQVFEQCAIAHHLRIAGQQVHSG